MFQRQTLVEGNSSQLRNTMQGDIVYINWLFYIRRSYVATSSFFWCQKKKKGSRMGCCLFLSFKWKIRETGRKDSSNERLWRREKEEERQHRLWRREEEKQYRQWNEGGSGEDTVVTHCGRRRRKKHSEGRKGKDYEEEEE